MREDTSQYDPVRNSVTLCGENDAVGRLVPIFVFQVLRRVRDALSESSGQMIPYQIS
jgi:hypothetical protein